MHFKKCRYSIFLAISFPFIAVAQKSVFPIVTATSKVTIVYEKGSAQLDSISAFLLAEDIERVTSFRPDLITNISKAKGNLIVIG